MAYSTCNNYLKRFTDVTALKAGIQRHASSNGVQINLGENINDIARFRQGIPRQKRPIAKNILEAPQPKRARIAPPVVIEDLHAAVIDTVFEELQAAVVAAPPAIAVNGAEIIEFVLKLSNGADFIVPVRRDGYVNVTKICQAAGKRLQHYKDRAENKHFLDRYIALTRIRANAIFEVIQGGNLANVEQGTFAHPDIAIHIAQWCSADFSIQVIMWIKELRIENTQLLTQIEELQAAFVAAPPAIAPNGPRKPLVLNGITIEVDPQTLMVNATQMCSAAGKFYAHYSTTIGMTEYKNALSSAIGIPIAELIKCKNGNREGTMVHRRIALYLAQRLSADFAVQVTGWLEELFTTGRVELGNEMSPQQLDEAWQQRVIDAQRLQKDAEDRLAGAIEETRNELMAKATEERELAVQKTREELDAAIKTLARDTEQMPPFSDGANVLYAGYIDYGLIKYGQSSNFTRRIADHRRTYPEFMLIKALPCDNAVASEKKLREYVAKKRIGGNYNNEKEIVCFETQEDVYKLMGAMQRSCRNKDSVVSVELKRIEADVEMKRMDVEKNKIEAEVEMKRMDVEKNKIETEVDVEKNKIETMRMKMIADKIITFEQYLQMK